MIIEKVDLSAAEVGNEGGPTFYSALAKQANKAIEGIYNTTITPIEYPAQGDFNWFWENGNNVFNEGTFNYISARVFNGNIQGNARITPAGGFPNACAQVITGMAFTLRKADQAKLNQAQADASAQANATVNVYQQIFGAITEEDMKKAGEALGEAIKTKLDYVVSYVLGAVWSGRLKAKKPPLTWKEMFEAENLHKLLPDMPASGEPVVTAVQIYLNILGPARALQDLLNRGGWILRQLNTNTKDPSAENGGMKLVNGEGVVSPDYQVGYRINKAITAIKNDLNNTGQVFSLGMSVSKAIHGQLQVTINGEGGGTVLVDNLFNFGISGHFNYDMNTFAGTSSSCKVTMKFPGFTMIPCEPVPWQQATSDGWFYGDPIAEAWKNWQASGGNPDVTGFNFTAKPTYNLGPLNKQGDFGLIKSLLISNYPTIEISYANANYAQFMQSWKTSQTGNLTLFGFLPLGSFSKGAYGSQVIQGATNSEFTVKFTPSEPVLTVPDLQKTAYVIGGAFVFPGSPKSLVERMLESE